MINMGSINVNMGVPRPGLLVACLESCGASRLQTETLHIDLDDLYKKMRRIVLVTWGATACRWDLLHGYSHWGGRKDEWRGKEELIHMGSNKLRRTTRVV
jgi:hypothetical protein